MIARRLLALATAAVLLTPAGCGTARPAPVASAAPAVHNAADVAFLQALLPHHRQGVEIAAIGAAKATRPDVKILAGAIVATEQDEQTRMAGWLTAWHQPATGAVPGPATPAEKIEALRTAPAKTLDHDLLTLLIAHQQAAVALAATESATGRNPGAVTFARQIEESRAAQIDQLRTWLAAA